LDIQYLNPTNTKQFFKN